MDFLASKEYWDNVFLSKLPLPQKDIKKMLMYRMISYRKYLHVWKRRRYWTAEWNRFRKRFMEKELLTGNRRIILCHYIESRDL